MSKPLFSVRVDVVHRVAPKTKAKPSRRRRQLGASTRPIQPPKVGGELFAEVLGSKKIVLHWK